MDYPSSVCVRVAFDRPRRLLFPVCLLPDEPPSLDFFAITILPVFRSANRVPSGHTLSRAGVDDSASRRLDRGPPGTQEPTADVGSRGWCPPTRFQDELSLRARSHSGGRAGLSIEGLTLSV